ncbi:MAG: hypothetical protein GY930_11540 [bacterium]|nr:hypothetical protein [bacterium]
MSDPELLVQERETTAGMWEWRMVVGGVVVRACDHPHVSLEACRREIRHILGIIQAWTDLYENGPTNWRTVARLPGAPESDSGAQGGMVAPESPRGTPLRAPGAADVMPSLHDNPKYEGRWLQGG